MHCSPNNRKPVAAARIKVESPEAPDISKGAITLNHEFESLKTADNAERKARAAYLSRGYLPRCRHCNTACLAHNPLRCRRWVLRLFSREFPLPPPDFSLFCRIRPLPSLGSFPLFAGLAPLAATRLRTSFARIATLPPLGSMRLSQSLTRCGAARLSQSLPRWVGPPLAKTKILTSLQFFFRLGTPSCSQKAKTSRFTADLLHFRADIRTLALRNNP